EAQGFGRYPPIPGTEDLRRAIAHWLGWRYGLDGIIDPDAHILPLNGTREGLFLSPQFLRSAQSGGAIPAILMPNPFYPVYAAGAIGAGAEPVYLPATAQNGFLPDLAAIPEDLLARIAGMYLCSPSNPQGAVAPASYLETAIDLARKHDFILYADECYAEIYTGSPPPGILEVARKTGSFANILAFHSLSKRSNLPGLRSGFCAGDERLIRRLARLRNIAAPQTPLPLQAAAAAAWRDEAHVRENRRLYSAKFDAMDEIIGKAFGYQRPGGGFFVWLDMQALGGSEAAALRLWREAGVRVLPGAYLGQEVAGENPGADYIRVALVADEDTTRMALQRMRKVLGE
ncbi:MAG TPA: aminotransferase class I/II-fold pyridoxal phosphate-dependent enzyme, partial [Rhizobiales bacterium]|nr:aminotransferase class I/II-fold pyridoxal phosphate-dependent enzyme [Hyphomicrobiales bacterium]